MDTLGPLLFQRVAADLSLVLWSCEQSVKAAGAESVSRPMRSPSPAMRHETRQQWKPVLLQPTPEGLAAHFHLRNGALTIPIQLVCPCV